VFFFFFFLTTIYNLEAFIHLPRCYTLILPAFSATGLSGDHHCHAMLCDEWVRNKCTVLYSFSTLKRWEVSRVRYHRRTFTFNIMPSVVHSGISNPVSRSGIEKRFYYCIIIIINILHEYLPHPFSQTSLLTNYSSCFSTKPGEPLVVAGQ
jgi:hypothetical protein